MSDEEKKRPEPEININLGLGGIFKGLGDMMSLLSQMAEQAEGETTRSGEFRVKGAGDKVSGVYGFTVRSGIGGVPRVERFGNIRTTEKGPEVAETREPLVDLFDEAHEMVVVAELPGVNEADITVEIHDDILNLETSGERRYAREVLLPAKAAAASMQKTYRNGILEIRVQKA
ncbi:MAG: Hsp20/alpha crystallin family protein [Chloroflexaceae bacterium]|jgi:HSP20 family protein|nr:Hsp20/alpha crystallin family protein [Chloroflexaceae bacterium]